jgi:sulfatase modifying factor 1
MNRPIKGFFCVVLIASAVLFLVAGCPSPGGGGQGPVRFTMIPCPGGTFPTGTDDLGGDAAVGTFYIAETEVTYELWSAVYNWATNGTGGAPGEGQYTFANAGVMGDGNGDTNQHPVTFISWRDAMVWTNALTEWYNDTYCTNYTCAYYSDGQRTIPIRSCDDSDTITDGINGSQDFPFEGDFISGFQLPSSKQWECAARYLGTNNPGYGIERPLFSGYYWTPGNYASGAADDYNNADWTEAVAWYTANSGAGAHRVKGRASNALGIYDMSGNVYELCFDWMPGFEGSFRVLRGGAWNTTAEPIRVGRVNGVIPYEKSYVTGFRVIRWTPSSN